MLWPAITGDMQLRESMCCVNYAQIGSTGLQHLRNVKDVKSCPARHTCSCSPWQQSTPWYSTAWQVFVCSWNVSWIHNCFTASIIVLTSVPPCAATVTMAAAGNRYSLLEERPVWRMAFKQQRGPYTVQAAPRAIHRPKVIVSHQTGCQGPPVPAWSCQSWVPHTAVDS